jgi:hypothetical protein
MFNTMIINQKIEQAATRISLTCPWLKRVGFYGFLFFLIKGLAWLIVPAVLYYMGTQ